MRHRETAGRGPVERLRKDVRPRPPPLAVIDRLRRTGFRATAVIACFLLAAACGDPPTGGRLVENPLEPEPADSPGPIGTPAKTPSPQDVIPEELEGARTVSIPAVDGVRVVDTLFGDDEDRPEGVLLVHRDGASKGSWYPLAMELMERGYAALALDLRGHGQSEGSRDPDKYPLDVSAGLDVLYLVGVDRAAVIGTEVGGTAGVAAANEWRPPEGDSIVRGAITIESEPTFESLDATEDARELGVPALVFDDDDSELADLIEDATYERSTQNPDRASSGGLVDAILAFLSEHVEG